MVPTASVAPALSAANSTDVAAVPVIVVPVSLTFTVTVSADVVAPVRASRNVASVPSVTSLVTADTVTTGSGVSVVSVVADAVPDAGPVPAALIADTR